MYLAFLSKPLQRTLNAGNIRLREAKDVSLVYKVFKSKYIVTFKKNKQHKQHIAQWRPCKYKKKTVLNTIRETGRVMLNHLLTFQTLLWPSPCRFCETAPTVPCLPGEPRGHPQVPVQGLSSPQRCARETWRLWVPDEPSYGARSQTAASRIP